MNVTTEERIRLLKHGAELMKQRNRSKSSTRWNYYNTRLEAIMDNLAREHGLGYCDAQNQMYALILRG